MRTGKPRVSLIKVTRRGMFGGAYLGCRGHHTCPDTETEEQLIDLYYWITPNGHKILILLEEARRCCVSAGCSTLLTSGPDRRVRSGGAGT